MKKEIKRKNIQLKTHKDHVDHLAKEIQKKYQVIMKEVEIRDPKSNRVVGEADIMGILHGELHLFEVKSGDDYYKAKQQLHKLRNFFKDEHDIKLFYYSGKLKEIQRIR